MSDFFPDPPDVQEERDEPPQPEWYGPPPNVLPGIVPVELVLGRSETAVVTLTGLRAFAPGLAMTLGVWTRAFPRGLSLNEEVFNGPYRHDLDENWRRDRLKWGFEYADGRRATNIDAWPSPGVVKAPDRPVLIGGGGGEWSVDAVTGCGRFHRPAC